MESDDTKKNMQKSLEVAARTYKAAKEMEQSALKMKRLADELLEQVEKTMSLFKKSGKDFLESYNEVKTPQENPSETEPLKPPVLKEKSASRFVVKRKTPSSE